MGVHYDKSIKKDVKIFPAGSIHKRNIKRTPQW